MTPIQALFSDQETVVVASSQPTMAGRSRVSIVTPASQRAGGRQGGTLASMLPSPDNPTAPKTDKPMNKKPITAGRTLKIITPSTKILRIYSILTGQRIPVRRRRRLF